MLGASGAATTRVSASVSSASVSNRSVVPAVTSRFSGVAEGEDEVARGHRLDERGVRAPDRGRLDVGQGAALEVGVGLAVEAAEQADARVGRGQASEPALYVVRVRRIADDEQRHVAGDGRVGADDEVGLVLGLETADVEDVATGLDARQPVAREVRRRVALERASRRRR